MVWVTCVGLMVMVHSLMPLTSIILLTELSGPRSLLLLFCIHHHVDMATNTSIITDWAQITRLYLTDAELTMTGQTVTPSKKKMVCWDEEQHIAWTVSLPAPATQHRISKTHSQGFHCMLLHTTVDIFSRWSVAISVCSADASHSTAALRINQCQVFSILDYLFAAWEWYAFYCKSHVMIGW